MSRTRGGQVPDVREGLGVGTPSIRCDSRSSCSEKKKFSLTLFSLPPNPRFHLKRISERIIERIIGGLVQGLLFDRRKRPPFLLLKVGYLNVQSWGLISGYSLCSSLSSSTSPTASFSDGRFFDLRRGL